MSLKSPLPVMEKEGLLPAPTPVVQRPKRRLSTGFYVLLTAVCTGLAMYSLGSGPRHAFGLGRMDVDLSADLCPQPSPLVPSKNEELWSTLGAKYSTKDFLGEAVELLGGAVRVP